MDAQQVIAELRSLGSPTHREGQRRFGITPRTEQLGVSVPALRQIARRIGNNHGLALKLWTSGVHEARILASMVADPQKVDERLMDRWVQGFDSWDVCDGVCGNLFDRTPMAVRKARQWCRRDEEFVRRAGFSLIASMAVHRKDLPDEVFERLLIVIERGAGDDRNFVKKAANWALRAIGKRSRRLNGAAIACARRITRQSTLPARWVAAHALRELRSPAVRNRLGITRSRRQ